MILTTTVCQDHHAPQPSSSACLDTVQISLIIAIVLRSGSMHPISPLAWLTTTFSSLILCVFRLISTGLHGQAAVKRTHANNIKLRLNTGATGHDEGNEILIRS